jgi:hypothetical protein
MNAPFAERVCRVTVWDVDRRPDADDWFAGSDPEGRRMLDAPSEEDVAPRADDWLSEAGGAPLRPSWVQTIDRRVVAVGASLLVLLLAGLAAGGVFSGGGAKAPTSTSSRTVTTQTTAAATTAPPARQLPAPVTTLKPGDTGTQVAVLQRALASLGFSSGKADGQYGPATKDAVARFQHSAGLAADGILGPATLRALATALRGR